MRSSTPDVQLLRVNQLKPDDLFAIAVAAGVE